VVYRTNTYFVKNYTNSNTKYIEDEIVNMINFFIHNVFGGKIFNKTVGIPMVTNGVPLPTDLFLHSYEAEFV